MSHLIKNCTKISPNRNDSQQIISENVWGKSNLNKILQITYKLLKNIRINQFFPSPHFPHLGTLGNCPQFSPISPHPFRGGENGDRGWGNQNGDD